VPLWRLAVGVRGREVTFEFKGKFKGKGGYEAGDWLVRDRAGPARAGDSVQWQR
jgi:hypothetical protein